MATILVIWPGPFKQTCFPIVRKLHKKFIYNWPSRFRETVPWSVERPAVQVTSGQGRQMTLTFDIHRHSYLPSPMLFFEYELFYLFAIQKPQGPNLTPLQHRSWLQNNWPSGSEEDFKALPIFELSRHLGHVTWTIRTNFRPPIFRKLHMKVDWNWLSGFREEVL